VTSWDWSKTKWGEWGYCVKEDVSGTRCGGDRKDKLNDNKLSYIIFCDKMGIAIFKHDKVGRARLQNVTTWGCRQIKGSRSLWILKRER